MDISQPLRIAIASTHIDQLRKYSLSEEAREYLYRESQSDVLDRRVSDAINQSTLADIPIYVSDEKELRWLIDGIKRSIKEYDALPFSEQQIHPHMRTKREDDDQYRVVIAAAPDYLETYQIPLLYRFTIDEAKDCLAYIKKQENSILKSLFERCHEIKLGEKSYLIRTRWDFLNFCEALKTAINFYEKDPRYVNRMMVKYRSSLSWFDKLVFHSRRILRWFSKT